MNISNKEYKVENIKLVDYVLAESLYLLDEIAILIMFEFSIQNMRR